MTIAPINVVSPQVSNYVGLQPLHAAVLSNTNNLPKTALPTELPGTVQENTHNIAPVVTYNAHGVLDAKKPNALIVHA
jgi:hypothetical protein